MTELVSFGEAMLRYSPPDQGRIETTETLEVAVGGAESNVATAAARIGTDAAWLSKLPRSPLGRRVTGFLHGYGLETDVVWTDDGRVGTYYVEFGGKPRGTHVLYDREGAAITTATVDELPTDRIRDAAMFVTSGITPALSATLEETTAELLSIAQSAGTTTVLDVNYRSKLWSPAAARTTLEELFPAVDVLVTTKRDAAAVFECEGSPEDVLRSISNQWDFERVLLTCGAAGAVTIAEDRIVEQSSFETDTCDPIGTGDAFLGVMLGRLLEGASIEEALRWGAGAAALKRTIPGDVAVIDRGEIEALLDSESSGIRR